MDNMIENTILASQEKTETEGKKMIRYIIRECAHPEFNGFFDTDCFDGDACGDYNYYLFIVAKDGRRYSKYYGINADEFENVVQKAAEIIDDMQYAEEHGKKHNGEKYTYKDAIIDNGYKYNSTICHKLKEWYKKTGKRYYDSIESITEFLSIITGKEWTHMQVHGCCQGDYCNVVFCTEKYTGEYARICGDLFLGCGKEFSITYLDDNGTEIDTVYGYYIADSQTWKDNEYKHIICTQEGFNESETQLQLIKNRRMVETYDYEIV